ncbi:MAG: ABC transporter substrate-binding protein [Lachnospiraceae bacterium]
MKKTLAILLATGMVIGLAGCSSSSSQMGAGTAATTDAARQNGSPQGTDSPADGSEKSVNIAFTVDMGDMAPFALPTSGRNYLRYSVYDYIAVFSEFGQSWQDMDWDVAKNITQIDEVTYEIEIYDYVKDAIGNHITADDVAWCIDTYIASGNLPRLGKYVDSTEVVDDTTFRIKLKTTTIGALEYVFAQVCIVDKDTYEANKDKMSTTPITSAAYQITDCVSGSYYVLERNDNYWQTDEAARCYIANQQADKLVYNVVKEPSQVTISLQTGENNMTTVLSQSELSYFMNDDGTEVPGYHISEMAGGTANTLHFNCSEGNVFADNLALRQAVLYAFDAQAIVDGVYKGHGEVIHDLATSLCGDYNKKWDTEDYYDYSEEKAKQKLEEAGYAGGIDPATGKTLNIRLMSDTEHKDAAVIMQSYLIAAGLDCELLIYDNALLSSYVFDPTTFDVLLSYHGSEGYVTAVYDTMLAINSEGQAAKLFVQDDKLQELLAAATNVDTHSEETVEALHDYVYEQAYAVGVNVTYSYAAANDTIGIVRHPWGQLIGAACDYTNFK